MLALYDRAGNIVAANDNWKDSQQSEIVATTIFPADDLESAIVTALTEGAYTARLYGANGAKGVALIELYDLNPVGPARLANISTRGRVETSDDVMIGGFIVAGTNPARILLRAVGPSLAAAGVADTLQDPMLELRDGNGDLVAENDNWKDTQQPQIKATTIPPGDDRESAIVATLSAGAYTAIVAGKNGGTGVGLVEIYNLSN